MAVPDFQSLMLPALTAVSKREIATSKNVIGDVTAHFKLSAEEQAQLLPSGTQRVIDNRVYWALIYLTRAGLIERPERGKYVLTRLGSETLGKEPARIDIKFLQQFESFRKFQSLSKTKTASAEEQERSIDPIADPRERLEQNYERLKTSICAELLDKLRHLDPTDFEKVVIELLKKMGYGVPGLDSVVHRGGVGDGGVDGEISQDSLGLDMIYVQAKRYQEGQTIGRPQVQQFVGSLNERKAKKGVFITTSHFSDEATEYIERVDMKIVLIDGLKLAGLMFDYNLGVVVEQKFEVKKLDSDFFEAA